MKAAIVSYSTENGPFTCAVEMKVSLFVQPQRFLTTFKKTSILRWKSVNHWNKQKVIFSVLTNISRWCKRTADEMVACARAINPRPLFTVTCETLKNKPLVFFKTRVILYSNYRPIIIPYNFFWCLISTLYNKNKGIPKRFVPYTVENLLKSSRFQKQIFNINK